MDKINELKEKWSQGGAERRKIIMIGVLAILSFFVVSRLFFGTGSKNPSESILAREEAKKELQEQHGREALIQAYYQEAMVAHQKGDYSEGMIAVEKLLQMDPHHQEGMKLKGEIEKVQKTSQEVRSASLQEEVRIQQLMQKVQQALHDKDPLTAKLILHQILEERSNHENAGALLLKLEKERVERREEEKRLEKEREKVLGSAEERYRKAQNEENQDRLSEAYRIYLDLQALFKKNDLKPDFWQKLQGDQKRVYQKLVAKMEPQFQKARLLVKQARGVSKKEEKVELYHGAAEQLLSLNRPDYPKHPQADSELQKIYSELNLLAELDFIKAKTLDELETCELATPGYRQAASIARFEEVPIYQMAKTALANCK